MAGKRNGPNALGAGSPEHGNDGGTVGDQSDGGIGGADIAGLPVVDPAAIAGSGTEQPSAGEQPRRGRGRPAGSSGKRGPKPKTERASETSVKGLSKILLSIHEMMAGFTGAIEMRLDEAESKALADAVADVASHYSVTADPKTMAWVNLAAACGMIYGPRLGAMKLRHAMNKPAKKPSLVPAAAPASGIPGGIRSADAPVEQPTSNGFVMPAAVRQ